MTAEEKRKRRSERERLRYQHRKAEGLCPTCGRVPENGVLCTHCAERIREYTKTPAMREWRTEWEKSDKQRKFRREQRRRLKHRERPA